MACRIFFVVDFGSFSDVNSCACSAEMVVSNSSLPSIKRACARASSLMSQLNGSYFKSTLMMRPAGPQSPRGAPEVRLVRQTAPNGQVRLLATNLDAKAFPAALFGDLDRQRWRIEEAFKPINLNPCSPASKLIATC